MLPKKRNEKKNPNDNTTRNEIFRTCVYMYIHIDR